MLISNSGPVGFGAKDGSIAAPQLDDMDAAIKYCERRHLHLERTSLGEWTIRADIHPGRPGPIIGRISQQDGRLRWTIVAGGASSGLDSLLQTVTDLIAASLVEAPSRAQ